MVDDDSFDAGRFSQPPPTNVNWDSYQQGQNLRAWNEARNQEMMANSRPATPAFDWGDSHTPGSGGASGGGVDFDAGGCAPAVLWLVVIGGAIAAVVSALPLLGEALDYLARHDGPALTRDPVMAWVLEAYRWFIVVPARYVLRMGAFVYFSLRADVTPYPNLNKILAAGALIVALGLAWLVLLGLHRLTGSRLPRIALGLFLAPAAIAVLWTGVTLGYGWLFAQDGRPATLAAPLPPPPAAEGKGFTMLGLTLAKTSVPDATAILAARGEQVVAKGSGRVFAMDTAGLPDPAQASVQGVRYAFEPTSRLLGAVLIRSQPAGPVGAAFRRRARQLALSYQMTARTPDLAVYAARGAAIELSRGDDGIIETYRYDGLPAEFVAAARSMVLAPPGPAPARGPARAPLAKGHR